MLDLNRQDSTRRSCFWSCR